MTSIRDLFTTAVILLALPLAAAALEPEDALAIAKEKMYAQYPELAHPQVKISQKFHGDKLMKLVFSNPFNLNGETYWNINTQYIWYGDPKIEYHYVGGVKGPKDAPAPFDGTVDPSIKPEVVKYLAYLNAGTSLNPSLRTAAEPARVHTFAFKKSTGNFDTDIYKIIGVDDTGATFHPNPFSTLVPKP